MDRWLIKQKTGGETDKTEYLNDPRIPCKYGSKCYQKNETHHKKYKHPPKRPSTVEDKRPAKKLKLFDKPSEALEGKHKTEEVCSSKQSSDTTRPDKIELSESCVGIPKKTEEVTSSRRSSGNSDGDSTDIIENSSPNDSTERLESTTESGEILALAKTKISEEIKQKCDPKIFIHEKFLVDMPEDFYQFWDFCKTLNEKNPCDAFKTIGLTLVGPYDVIAGRFKGITKKSPEEYLVHWRYYRDPPEFQTVLKGSDSTGYHIGYFRDSPDEMPVFLAYNKAKENGVFKTIGDNIFAAVNFYLEELKKTGDPFKKMQIGKLQNALRKEAENLKLDLSEKTNKMIERDKKIVARSFNKIGLVVAYDRKSQLGYRELTFTNKEILNLFNKLEKALPDQKPKILSQLQPMFTFASIAADECDFGTGIELGLDIIAHGLSGLDDTAMRFLSSNYRLLNREAFAKIAEAHMKNRRKGCELSIL